MENMNVNWRTKSFQYAKTGVSFGSVLAITISWSVNHSIIWAIIHGIFSWLYVIYYVFFVRYMIVPR